VRRKYFCRWTLNLKVLSNTFESCGKNFNPNPYEDLFKKICYWLPCNCQCFSIHYEFILGPELKFYPPDGNWYPGENSPVAWKGTMSSIIYPVKFVLVEPLTFLAQDTDGAPPVILFFFALYWTVMALILYYVIYLFNKIMARKET
jgi:hypothetical protein